MRKSLKSDLSLCFRQLFRTPISFLYTFYVKMQRFLPWNIFRVAITFCKSKKRRFRGNDHVFHPVVRSFLWQPPRRTPQEEMQHYWAYFSNKYGTTHPAFYRGTLSDVWKICFSVCHEFQRYFRLYEMHSVKFDYYLFIYMIKIPRYAIDFVGKSSDI